MKFAAIADIHGNNLALEAVLNDIKKQQIKTVINLGDHFSGPLVGCKASELLMEQTLITINGNHDRWLLEMAPDNMGPSDRAAYDQLSADQLKWLEKHPATYVLHDEIFLCHGTPDSDVTYLLEHVTDTGSVRLSKKEEIKQKLGNTDYPLILCGHTHIPRAVRIDTGQLIINPGSVGCPAYTDDKPAFHIMQIGTPAACYAIIEQTNGLWTTEFRYIPYDHRKMSQLAKEKQRPDWAEALETGWIES